MQDKIQEIMVFVDAYANSCEHELAATYHGTVSYGDSGIARKTIESKLRELVRKPLSDDQIDEYIKHADMHGRYAEPFARGVRWGIRHYERAHGITNSSGVE